MVSKAEIHNAMMALLAQKIDALQAEINTINDSLTTATKSSAGDKHETSRAMLQLEQERIGKQFSQLTHMRDIAKSINPKSTHSTIQLGSLINTNSGDFYISIALGKVENVFCMSPTTPLAQVFLGKKEGDEIQFNGNTYRINSLT